MLKLNAISTPGNPATLAVAQDFSTHVDVVVFHKHVGNPVLEISQFSIDLLAAQVVGKS